MTKIFLKKKDFQALVNLENDEKLSIVLKDLDFSVRTMNCLSNQGLKTIGELVVYSENELRSFPNMGRKSIEEIKNILEHFSFHLGMDLNQFNSEDYRKIEDQQNKEWQEVSRTVLLELIKDFNEISLSLRAKNALWNLGCNYVGDIISINKPELFRFKALGYKSILEIEDYLKSLNLNFGDQLDPWKKDVIIKLRKELREEVSAIKKFELIDQDKYLEVELNRVIDECVSTSKKDPNIKSRIKDILINRFGLDGSPAKTLEIIGKKYNVTRERIRQNEVYGLRKLKFSKPITPILDKIFEILNKSLPITEIEFNQILNKKNLTKMEWDFKGIQDFYESFGGKKDFYISKINKIKVISKSSVNYSFREVMKNIKKKISNYGLYSIDEILKFDDIISNNIKKETIKKFIQTVPLFVWLDKDENWFTFYSTRNRLSNLISKAAIVKKQTNTDYLFNKLKKHHRLDKIIYDKEIFIKFCEQCFNCYIEKDLIIFNSPKSKLSDYDGYKGNIISPNEQKIIEIFNKFGPILNWTEIKEFSIKSGVSEYSLNMMMQFSPLFQRIDKATYVLSGSKLDGVFGKAKIDLMSKSYKKIECRYLENEKQYYIEVYKLGKYLKTIAYPRTLMKINESSKGVIYENKIYPIITS